MFKKIIETEGPSMYHPTHILEGTNIEVDNLTEGYAYVSDYHPNVKRAIFIGEFTVTDSTIDEDVKISDQITDGKKTYNYQIYVYSNEGPIPHFHVIDVTNNTKKNTTSSHSNKDACICIYKPVYFSHGSHTSTLNSKELKVLDTFLRTGYDGTTYWDSICFLWKINNPNMVRDYPQHYPQTKEANKQPDYTRISSSTFVSNR